MIKNSTPSIHSLITSHLVGEQGHPCLYKKGMQLENCRLMLIYLNHNLSE